MRLQSSSPRWMQAVVLVATLAGAAVAVDAAQTRGVFVSPNTGVAVGSVWGVFIGVSHYRTQELNLSFADRDAEALHRFFAAQF